ncbi:MAG: WbqC family protein [Alphaproteobacteria bacterium]
MTVAAIMQPYFFPYIGYWQMISAADTFVIYDDVNYIKGGWINRNNLLLKHEPHLFTLSLDQASPFKKINDITIQAASGNRAKILAIVSSAYKKAPHYKRVFPFLESVILNQEPNLALFLHKQICDVCHFLGIQTKIILSSNLAKNNDLRGQDKVIEICKNLKAHTYINAIGGTKLYSKADFQAQEINLNFILSQPVPYAQIDAPFVPWLSIIDVMMFNDRQDITRLLKAYVLT